MKEILIHCAMQKEAYTIAQKLSLIEKETEIFKLYSGSQKQTNIRLLVTGIGKQKTAIGLVRYLETYKKPDTIINIGYVGSTNSQIGKWINVDKSYNLEWDIPGEERYNMDIGNQDLIKINGVENLPCYSAESFVTSTNIKENVVFDMELHSVCLVADIYKIPVLSLKKVSDNLSLDDYYKNIDDTSLIELESAINYIEKYIS